MNKIFLLTLMLLLCLVIIGCSLNNSRDNNQTNPSDNDTTSIYSDEEVSEPIFESMDNPVETNDMAEIETINETNSVTENIAKEDPSAESPTLNSESIETLIETNDVIETEVYEEITVGIEISSAENNQETKEPDGSSTTSDNETITNPIISVTEPRSQYIVSCQTVYEHPISSNDISVKLCYGLNGSFVPEDYPFTNIQICAQNNNGQYFVIKNFDILYLLEPEYKVQVFWDDTWESIVDIIFSHEETISLPATLFSDEKGLISIGIREYYVTESGEESFGASGGITLNYLRTPTNIYLSNFEFIT